MRPTLLHIGGTLYWSIYIYNPDTQVLKDADSTPSVSVRKNGSSTGDSVTITKRSATTGIYDCSYNPSAEVEGDEFLFEESAVVTGSITSQATYNHIWALTVISFESGLDASGIRSAIGLSTANLDTQLSDIASDALIASAAASQLLGVDTDVGKEIRSMVGLDGATLSSDLKYISDNTAMIVRSTADTNPISFMFPSPSLTLSGSVSINDGNFQAVAGTITYLRTENEQYFYSLAYNASDRPASEGVARYTFTNSGTHVHVMLRVEASIPASLSASDIRSAVGLASANMDTQLASIISYIDTEITAIKAKTDNLPVDPADASDIAASFSSLASTLSTIASYIDTEVAAIKAKTDNLPASPAAVSHIPTAIQIREEMDSNSVKLSEIKALTILGSGDQTSADFSNDYYNAIADAVLTRNVSNVEDTLEEHTLGGAIMGQLEWSLDGSGNLTVYKTDGTTELYTKVVNSTTSDGNVITGLE